MNEREDKYEGHDEGEYHFSDDQSTYELEPEVDAEAEAPTKLSTPSSKANPFANISRYRRMIIGVVVFFVVLFVVYKMIIPASTPPATEFSETANKPTAAAKPKTMAPPVVQPQAQAAPAPQAIPVQQPNPMSAPPVQAAPTFPANNPAAAPQQPMFTQPTPTAAAPAPTMAAPPMVVAPEAQTPPAPVANQQPQSQQPAMMAPQPISTTTANMPPPPLAEQQPGRMEAEYAQKLAEAQAQNAALQSKIHELNSRLSNIEATLNQLTQAILNKQMSSGPTMQQAPMQPAIPVVGGRGNEPRMAYTVQAIIPGRAWLKSDAGDTVTVAEGDILKDYGRITKIDPYDGVVSIDTGTKTITLSYGSSGD